MIQFIIFLTVEDIFIIYSFHLFIMYIYIDIQIGVFHYPKTYL